MGTDWNARQEALEQGRGYRMVIERSGSAVSWGEVVACWQREPGFRDFLTRTLAEVPLEAFRWETPPVTRDTLDQPFEFVLLNAPALKRRADPADFAEQFRDAGPDDVLDFSNLGGDAHLLVPAPGRDVDAYPHFGAFLRHAPAAQRDELWRRLGAVLAARVGPRPLWVNTAGTGVPWLHLRLDTRPKYYLHAPYRRSS